MCRRPAPPSIGAVIRTLLRVVLLPDRTRVFGDSRFRRFGQAAVLLYGLIIAIGTSADYVHYEVPDGWWPLLFAIVLGTFALMLFTPLGAWRLATAGLFVMRLLHAEEPAVLGGWQWCWYLPVLVGVGLLYGGRVVLVVAVITTGAVYLVGTMGNLDYLPPTFLFLGLSLLVSYAFGARGRAERRFHEERDAKAALVERARIAREMHDVVAHHMSMVAVRCETAPYRIAGLPEAGLKEFAELGDAARAAIADMQGLLGGPPLGRPAGRPGAAAGAERHRRAGPAGLGDRRRRAARRGAHRVPGGPGGADQREPPRSGVERLRGGVGGRPRAGGVRPQHRGRPVAGWGWWARAGRHAGTRGGARRLGDRGAHAGRRFRGAGADSVGGALIRVLVVDDQEMVREGFSALLDAQPDIEVVGSAGDGAAGVAEVRRLRPDVVLMDVRMPGTDGLTATRLLADDPVKVLVLTTFDLDDYVYEALRAGASGFLLKHAPARELLEAVRVVARGDALLAPSVTKRLIEDFVKARLARPVKPAALSALTERETEVLRLIATGLSNTEIAAHLVLAEQTVKTHVSRVLMKLGLRDRAQAVIAAYESGLVVPG